LNPALRHRARARRRPVWRKGLLRERHPQPAVRTGVSLGMGRRGEQQCERERGLGYSHDINLFSHDINLFALCLSFRVARSL
jgi:hypothetical protein